VVEASEVVTYEDIERIIAQAEYEGGRLFLKTLFWTAARVSELVVGKDNDPIVPERVFVQHSSIKLRNLKSKLVKRKCRVCNTLIKAGTTRCVCGSEDIEETPNPKRWKTVVVPESLVRELSLYVQANNITPQQPIFNFDRFQAYRFIRKVCKKAGIEKVGDKWLHLHTFRHSYLTHGLKQGASLQFLQRQAGHSSIAMLTPYLDFDSSKRKEELAKMEAKT